MITTRSSYDQVVKEINEAAEELIQDYDDVSPDEFWTDLASSMLIEASETVAREVCRREIGFVPQNLERHFALRRIAKVETDRKKAQDRAVVLKAARAAREKQRRVAEISAVREARCDKCFTVRTPSGACNC